MTRHEQLTAFLELEERKAAAMATAIEALLAYVGRPDVAFAAEARILWGHLATELSNTRRRVSEWRELLAGLTVEEASDDLD